MVEAELEHLAAVAASGDRDALERLLHRIQPEVLRRCGRFLPCREDAEEACQDVLLRVAEHLPRFEWRSSFSTWLYTVVANSARDTYRSLRRRSDRQVAIDRVLDVRPDPRTTSVIAGSRLDLLEALDRLDATRPQLVAPFVLRDICQRSYAEIAEHLGAPLGTVKAQVHHARQAMQSLLAERG